VSVKIRRAVSWLRSHFPIVLSNNPVSERGFREVVEALIDALKDIDRRLERLEREGGGYCFVSSPSTPGTSGLTSYGFDRPDGDFFGYQLTQAFANFGLIHFFQSNGQIALIVNRKSGVLIQFQC